LGHGLNANGGAGGVNLGILRGTGRLMKIASGRRRVGILAIVLLAVLFAVFAADAGRMLVVDAPQRSDVILVLAGETDRRPARAMELLEQGYGRRVVIDVPAAEKIYGSSEIQIAGTSISTLRP